MPLKISGITRDPFRAKVCEPDAVELGAEGRTRHHESRLELTSAPTDDLRTWLSNEIELEATPIDFICLCAGVTTGGAGNWSS